MNPAIKHLGRSLALGFRDGFVIIGVMYMVITTYDLVNGTRTIHPTLDDYTMFSFIWVMIFLLRALFGKHPELPPRPTRRECLHTQYFQTDQAPAPAGPYSQALSRGNILALAGQVGIDPDTSELAEGIGAQTRQALTNLMAVAKAAQAPLSAIIHVRVYLADKNDFAAMNESYQEFWKSEGIHRLPSGEWLFPARTTVAVGLPEGMLVEIEALAVHQS
jgi:2-iminobutanoate/2-iminopropanoate deaminase